jgi:hypothetical protein
VGVVATLRGRLHGGVLGTSFTLVSKKLTLFFPYPHLLSYPKSRARLSLMPPRPTVVSLVLLILVAAILLIRPYSANLNGYSSYYRDVFGHGRSLRSWLADEEARYVVAVQERLELIKKWGPRDDAVDP